MKVMVKYDLAAAEEREEGIDETRMEFENVSREMVIYHDDKVDVLISCFVV